METIAANIKITRKLTYWPKLPIFIITITIIQVTFFIQHILWFYYNFDISISEVLWQSKNDIFPKSKFGLPSSLLAFQVSMLNPVFKKLVLCTTTISGMSEFLTSLLVHVDYNHLLNNVINQLFIGVSLESKEGVVRVMIIYITGGLAGSIGSYIFYPPSMVPRTICGASCAIIALEFAQYSPLIVEQLFKPHTFKVTVLHKLQMYCTSFIYYSVEWSICLFGISIFQYYSESSDDRMNPLIIILSPSSQLFQYLFRSYICWQQVGHFCGAVAGFVLSPLVLKKRNQHSLIDFITENELRKNLPFLEYSYFSFIMFINFQGSCLLIKLYEILDCALYDILFNPLKHEDNNTLMELPIYIKSLCKSIYFMRRWYCILFLAIIMSFIYTHFDVILTKILLVHITCVFSTVPFFYVLTVYYIILCTFNYVIMHF